ncbi:MAG: hypothetical protein MR691_15055 [Clostridium sp.]|nr:hypothetical protein [Clostridium sp.]
MKDSYISYYELLKRIKEGNIPPKIILHLVPNKSVEYISDYDYVSDKLVGYEILNDKDEDENYSYYLVDCFLESTMFDKVIEIIEEEKEIEKLQKPTLDEYIHITGEDLYKQDMKLYDKIDELIDEVKKLKEE